MRGMRWFGGAALAGLVLFAGCSGGGSSSSSTTVAPSPAASTAGGSTTVPSFVGSSSSAYCNLARQFSQTLNPNSSSDPKTLFAQFDTVSDRFLSTAPSAIQADATTVVGALKKLETAFKNANYDVTKIMPTDLAAIQDPKFTASTARIDAYDSQVCGITTSTT